MIHVYKEKEIVAAKAMTRERSKADLKRKLELRVNPVRSDGSELPVWQAKKAKAARPCGVHRSAILCRRTDPGNKARQF